MQTGPHHSNFCIDTLKRKEFSVEILNAFLPPAVRELLDLSDPAVHDVHYVDEKLKNYQSDILFSVSSVEREEMRIYLLFEHKSHPEMGVLLQLLKYQTRIYADQKEFIPVIAVVFHHGAENWNVPPRFQDLGNLTERERAGYGPYLLDLGYALIDLKRYDVERLRLSLAVRVFLAALRDIWHLGTPERLDEFLRRYRDVFFQSTHTEFIEKLIVYMLKAGNIEPESLRKRISAAVSEECEHMVVSAVERMEQKAREEGRLETAKNLIENGVALEIVLKSTGLTEEQLREAGTIK